MTSIQALKAIAEQCAGAADELLALLNKLELQSRCRSPSPWASIRHAIASVWSKEQLDEMLSRLDTYRSELALRTLVTLNEKMKGDMENHQKRFDRLEHKDNDIIQAISISQQANARETAEYHRETREQLREVFAAILTYRDGRISTLSQPVPQAMSWVSTDDTSLSQSLTFQSTESPNNSESGATVSLNDFTIVQHRVIQCLSFHKIRDRMDEVRPEFQGTCTWVFESPKATQSPWSHFTEWLQTGQGCYWINGKAGSGKSTLMKYIVNSSELNKSLRTWAGGMPLLVASYFSWNLGSSLQKTQAGLLRSLLRDILDRVPHLIPTVLPKLCKAVSLEENEQPNLLELRDGIRKLVQQTNTPVEDMPFRGRDR